MTEYVFHVSGSCKPPKGRNGKQRNALSLRTSFNVVQCSVLYSFSKWNNTFAQFVYLAEVSMQMWLSGLHFNTVGDNMRITMI